MYNNRNMHSSRLLYMMKQANTAASYSVLEKMAKEAEQAQATDDDQWVTIQKKDRSDVLRRAGILRSHLSAITRSVAKALGIGAAGTLLGGLGGGIYDWLSGDGGSTLNQGLRYGMYAGGLAGLHATSDDFYKYEKEDIKKAIANGQLRKIKGGKLQIRKDLLPV